MTLSNIEIVRLKTADKSTVTMDKFIYAQPTTKLSKSNIMTSPAATVYVGGVLRSSNYTLDTTYGFITFTAPLPNSGDEIEVDYFWSVFSDDEVSQFLSEAGDNTDYAAAKMLLAWASSYSRLAQRETLSGGGGTGMVTKDTSFAAIQLRETAKTLMDVYNNTAGTEFPVEMITEVPWTEQVWNRQVEQELVRDV